MSYSLPVNEKEREERDGLQEKNYNGCSFSSTANETSLSFRGLINF